MNDGAQSHKLANIRELLLNVFTTKTLNRFCVERPQFRPVTNDFSPAQGLGDMVDSLVEYCVKWLLLDELLAEVNNYSPGQYKLHEPYSTRMRIRKPVVNLRPWDRCDTFKDREVEKEILRDRLGKKAARLICVVGPGGIGKTALVCYVLSQIEPKDGIPNRISDEVCVDGILYLSAKSTGLSLDRIYDGAMQMLEEPTVSWLERRWVTAGTSLAAKVEYLLAALQGRSYIILLDNLENCLTRTGVIAEEGLRLFVEDCLRRTPNVRLIITSRRDVRLSPGLLASIHPVLLQEGLSEDDAISFLRDLDTEGHLGLRDAPLESLRAGSRYARGVPLALELVAGLLQDNRDACLDEVLADEKLFTEKVVNELLDQVYPHLGTDERYVLQALAVFDHPVDKEAISFLLQPWFPDLDMQSALRSLVRDFIVTVHRSTGEYSLHLVHWEYVDSRLPVNQKVDGYNRRNLQLRAAEYYRSRCKPEKEWYSVDDLAPQLAEYEHLIRAGDFDDACRVLNTVERYLDKWGYHTRLVELRGRLSKTLRDSVLEATNLVSLGEAYGALGQDEEAIGCYERALPITRTNDDRTRELHILRILGSAHRNLGHDQVAVEYFKQALSLAPVGQNREEKAYLLNDQGITFWHQEYVEQATDCFEEALSLAKDIRDDEFCSLTLGHLGLAYHKLGRLAHAVDTHTQALSKAQKIGHRQLETRHLSNIGYACHDLGEFKQAIDYQLRALEIAHKIGNLREESNQLDRLGSIYHSLGQFSDAIREYEKSLRMVRELRNSRGESYRRLSLGRAFLGKKELVRAQHHCAKALHLGISGWTTYMLPLTLGIILLYQEGATPEAFFVEAARCARDMLKRTKKLYKAQHALAAALVGQTVCDPAWQVENERPKLLVPAQAEYRRALDICSAPGVVHDALWNLKMIRDAGIEGLEPIFDLLENADN